MLDGNFGGNGFRVLFDWVYLDYRAFMKTIRTFVGKPKSFFPDTGDSYNYLRVRIT